MPQIKQAYNGLCELQDALFDLRTLVVRERQDIIGLNLKGMEGNRAEIEELFMRLMEIRDRTSAQIQEACEASGVTGAKNLSVLITRIPKPDRDLFARLQQGINDISAEVDNALKVNRGLLKDSIAFTSNSLETLTGMLKTSSIYGQMGRYVDGAPTPRIICKEA